MSIGQRNELSTQIHCHYSSHCSHCESDYLIIIFYLTTFYLTDSSVLLNNSYEMIAYIRLSQPLNVWMRKLENRTKPINLSNQIALYLMGFWLFSVNYISIQKFKRKTQSFQIDFSIDWGRCDRQTDWW